MPRLVRSAVLSISLVLGCGGSNEGHRDGGAIDLTPPPECVLDDAPPAGWTYPAGPYGGDVDDTVEDITLEDCDGNQVSLGTVLSQSQLLLFNIGAGWCQPCIEETETLDQNVFRAFCPRGLRVVQVLFETDESRRATKLFCNEWRNRYGLSFPVLIDPIGITTERYFDSVLEQTPMNFLVDPGGKIVFKETGTPAADLPQRIDQMLPAP